MRKVQFSLVSINIVLSIFAYQGVFEGKDLLPIVIGGIFVLIGLLLLWFKRTDPARYQLLGFAFVVLSSLGLYHIHFNIYNASKVSISRENSLQVLEGNKAPAITFMHHLNTSDRLNVETYIANHRFTILNFWATWCSPCLKEMPLLDDFYQANKDRNIGVIGFTDFRGKKEMELKKITNIIDKLEISYPLLIDSTTRVRSVYKADVLPATVLLNSEGEVLDYQIGLDGAEKIMHYINDNL